MTDVYTFGEAMLRLSVPPGELLLTRPQFDVHVAGAEANVATVLAGLGRDVSWASQLPDNTLGRRVLATLAGAGVDCSNVNLVDDARLGIYYVDLHNPPRATSVIYDRAGSAVCDIIPDDVDWDLVESAKIVHLTGITPALSESCSRTVRALAERTPGMTSFDVNYRAKLWSPETAAEHLSPSLELADVIICGIGDAVLLFDTPDEPGHAAHALSERFEAPQVVVTSGSDGAWWVDGDSSGHRPAIAVDMIDRLGAGDALTAGILDGLLDGDIASGVERGVTLAAVALITKGDAVSITRSELSSLLTSKGRSVDR